MRTINKSVIAKFVAALMVVLLALSGMSMNVYATAKTSSNDENRKARIAISSTVENVLRTDMNILFYPTGSGDSSALTYKGTYTDPTTGKEYKIYETDDNVNISTSGTFVLYTKISRLNKKTELTFNGT